jgi:hypothetical protein
MHVASCSPRARWQQGVGGASAVWASVVVVWCWQEAAAAGLRTCCAIGKELSAVAARSSGKV